MANAVTAYRDMSLADRNPDAGFVALFPYLQESQPPPAPLPPLAPARRVGSQNLPPVKTLLTQQEEWAQSKQNSEGKGRQNGAQNKMTSMSNAAETNISRSSDKPLKRGPKGPRKYSAPRPLGPLKPIAPKLIEKVEEDMAGTDKQKKPSSRRPSRRTDKKRKQPNLESTTSNESIATGTLLDLNSNAELDMSQSYGIPTYSTMGSGLLGGGNASIDSSTSAISNQSPTFPNLQQTPMDLQNHNQNTLIHVAALAYGSPQTSFSPVSDNASTFAQIYHSPVYPTSHSAHVSPHSAMSPMHSIHNSPHTFRSNLDPLQGLQSPIPQMTLASPSQIYPTRLANGNDQSPDLIGVDGQFHSPVDFVDPSLANILNGSGPTVKRKRGQDKSSDVPNAKRRTLKPRTAVTAIQSVLNPAHDGRLEIGPPSPLHPRSRNASPKKNRLPLPITPTSPHHLRLIGDNGMNTARLILTPGPTSGMSNGYPNPSPSLMDEQTRQYDLSTNSLAMVLNSEHGSSLASPQLYDFSPLEAANTQSDILPTSNPRDMNGRLPVQSLLTLPPLPPNHSPSMQVMQIQPSLLDQSSQLQNMELDQRRLGRSNDTNDPFDMRMSETHFGSQLADVVGTNLQPASSWADILLQPTNVTTYSTEMGTSAEPLYDSNQMSRMDEQQSSNVRFTESQSNLQQSLPTDPARDNRSEETESPADKRKRRGKHSRYVAVEGKNGEPDKTHVDVLVTVIQKSETNPGDPNPQPTTITNQTLDPRYEPMPSMDDVSLVISQNSLPSLETLQLVDTAANPNQSSQGRNILDEMAGIPSSQEQSYNNMMDLFSQEMPDWGTDLFPATTAGQVPLQVRYPQWNQQPEYTEPPSTAPPPPQPPPAKRGRKSKADREREAMEKAREADVAAAERRKAFPFVCHHPGCTTRFRQLEHLKVHSHTHEGIKPFKCDFEGCDKTFSQKGNLKAHQRKHTGEKPFVCPECDKAFAQKGNLQTHKSVHTGLKPYVCLIDNCTSRYSQRGNLKMHQNKFHTERIQQLTIKYEQSTKGGPPLDDQEQKLADHLKILYKYANKGIKGRGKKEGAQQQQQQQQQTSSPAPTRRQRPVPEPKPPKPTARGYPSSDQQPTLLPLPVSKPPTLHGTSPFLGMGGTTWGATRENVFVGNPSGGQNTVVQSGNAVGGTAGGGGGGGTFLGIPGDGSNSTGLGGYSFGNMG